MKRLVVLAGCAVILSVLGGCQGFSHSKRAVDVIIEGGGEFPQFLVGTWESEGKKWRFTFEPDGSISHFRHGGGMEFDVAQGGLVEQWQGGGQAVFALGSCTAEYDQINGQLKVTIIVESYLITFQDAAMEGSFHDDFSGQVSQDGTQWNAVWTSTGEVFGRSSDGPNSVMVKPLVFKKVSSTE